MKVSILMPVYNEITTIMDVIELVRNVKVEKEIIIVDDCSDDGTTQILKKHFGEICEGIKVIYHEKNKGKGAAIQTALAAATGEYIVVQDADMEYSPHDIERLLATARETGADAVYGSRFLDTWRTTSFVHYMVNGFLTLLTNVFFGGNLTDMETCYKLVRTDLMRQLDIKSEKFDFEPEVTAKLLKRGIDIKEISVAYRGRGYDEGKKIGAGDGVQAVITIFKLKFTKT
jgi:glycosyltransferase involved in cell wall biosynthesis